MSKATTIKVEKVIDSGIEEVRAILLDLQNYPKWWKAYNLKYDSDHETVSFQPLPLIEITLQVIEKGDNFIKFNYSKGPFRGCGLWEFKELETGKTYISYTITISGCNWLIDLIKSTVIFKWKHEKDIYKLMGLIGER
jgi:ribosome-associated toxin RatA of RatAB toxin-antitoxin module